MIVCAGGGDGGGVGAAQTGASSLFWAFQVASFQNPWIGSGLVPDVEGSVTQFPPALPQSTLKIDLALVRLLESPRHYIRVRLASDRNEFLHMIDLLAGVRKSSGGISIGPQGIDLPSFFGQGRRRCEMLMHRIGGAKRHQYRIQNRPIIGNLFSRAARQPSNILRKMEPVVLQAVIFGKVEDIGMVARIVPVLVLLKAQHVCVCKHVSKAPLGRSRHPAFDLYSAANHRLAVYARFSTK